jgi:hypothetical protein
VSAVKRETKTIPIVFNSVSDPIGAGVVDNLARPAGNVTGFMNFEYGLSGKWLDLLKEIAPRVTRAAVLRDSANPAGIAQFGAIRARASSLGLDVTPIDVREPGEIEGAVATFARPADGGLIVTGSASERFRYLIVKLAAQHKLPAVYSDRFEAAIGGLISYRPDGVEPYGARHGATCQSRRIRPSRVANACDPVGCKQIGVGASHPECKQRTGPRCGFCRSRPSTGRRTRDQRGFRLYQGR